MNLFCDSVYIDFVVFFAASLLSQTKKMSRHTMVSDHCDSWFDI